LRSVPTLKLCQYHVAGHRPPRSTDRPAEVRQAERRQLTVMFVDLVGSTALSQRLDPEDMREVIRVFQNAVAGEISRSEEHAAEVMGDGVLAYFGWAWAHEDESERPCGSLPALASCFSRAT
jgi:class 3 adenylate cyclase